MTISLDNNAPASGGILYAFGSSSIVRIPIPFTNGLCIEFFPRGYVPASGSTSTLFFQDITGKRHLRLDYGYNVKTKTIDYHWNQTGTHANFGINDRTSLENAGRVAYQAAKYFRYAGRVFVVVGVAVDVMSVVRSSRPIRQATAVVTGWALAWAGCKVVGIGGAALGTALSPIGTAVGGVGGCIIGGYGGYRAGNALGSTVYDWVETIFYPIPQVAAP